MNEPSETLSSDQEAIDALLDDLQKVTSSDDALLDMRDKHMEALDKMTAPDHGAK